MPLSEQQRVNLLASTRDAANAFIEDMENIREVLAREGASTGEVRRLSSVLRRLLVDRDLAAIASPRIGKLTLRAPDYNPIYKEASVSPPVFFAGGGAKVLGWNAMVLVARRATKNVVIDAPALGIPANFDVNRTVDLRLDNFLAQRVLCLRGEWISRKAAIKYVANVASGVHSNQPATLEDAILAHIRRSFHIKLQADGTIQISVFGDGLHSSETTFKALAPNSIDPVLIELLAAAHFLATSPDVIRLEEMIRAELFMD